MLTKEKFKELIQLMQQHNELYNKLYNLGIDIINCKHFETADVLFNELMESEFGPEGADLVSWWLYEDVDHKLYTPSDKMQEFYYPGEEVHGEVIADLNDIDNLYDYITKEEDDED